ncbi:putative glucan 1,3-beta-glucosidase [Medicago truncatula]|uniref:Glycoside hydrolase family 5 protein n=1 Tax=Medicago truncatula TaxID=3880 RepID=G7LAD4_MEDTR|nr:probable glucan 1,3-beta-glucosidase A [Medicago truncatula]AET04533.2 glycoside hydrolase family 5 protein [Medicago truncatula]RHN42959.1 putative glucan 1,3-beta-glucosidase [Medicago truncatula]
MCNKFFYVNLLFIFNLSLFHNVYAAETKKNNLPLKAVNLGNWLVTEGWMEPSLFDGIKNNDLLDGTHVQFMSVKLQKYLCAENGGGTIVVSNRTKAFHWETFRLWRVNETAFNLRVSNKQFVGLEDENGENNLVANLDSPGNKETFEIVRNDDDPNKVRIRAPNGLFLQAISETQVSTKTVYEESSWEDSDPSVFKMTVLTDTILKGEYQITNGYGPDKASKIMRDHWKTYITEEDFRFMSENGLNAVRIPVGWWIAKDPTPPKPFVGGSLKTLDNAFTWAHKYGMKVIVDLHAAPASQNGRAHSATRDGYREWGDSSISDTVATIDFLAQRYANRTSLIAIQLMNEPQGVDLGSLKKYYQAGYDAVRKYTSSAYVIMSNPLDRDSKVLLPFVRAFDRVVIDVHYYNLFSDQFSNMNVKQNIDYIKYHRASDLRSLTTSNGPLIFVGEWSGDWKVKNALKKDSQQFMKVQVEVYSRATFGWAYWAYKCDSNNWSLKWLLENNYVKL